MKNSKENLKGLSRLIFETMEEHTPELLAEGKHWTPEVLERLENDLRVELTPPGSKNSPFFNMVFTRSFMEASRAIVKSTAMEPMEPMPMNEVRATA